MTTNLQGADALKRRLKAAQLAFKPLGRTWADTAVELARPQLPTRPASMRAGDRHEPGRLHGSVRRLTATQRKAVVGAHYTAYFIDAGVAKPHSLVKRGRVTVNRETRTAVREVQDRTVFAKKHPGYRARPFRAYIAHESLRRHPMTKTIINEWNKSA